MWFGYVAADDYIKEEHVLSPTVFSYALELSGNTDFSRGSSLAFFSHIGVVIDRLQLKFAAYEVNIV